MSERGVFAVDRGVFDHPVFAPEPYTEREAWLWMIAEAAWKPRRVRVGRHPVDLQRGQLAFATRYLAAKFKWSESRIRRFLKRLETDAMVSVSATRDATQITICNYDKYAFDGRTNDAQTDAQTDEPATHSRRKYKEVKELEEVRIDSVTNVTGADAPIDPSIAERDLFRRGKEVLGSGAGGLIAKLKRHFGGNVASTRAAIETASTKQNPSEYVAAIIRGPPAGIVAPMTPQQIDRQNWRQNLAKLSEYAADVDEEGRAIRGTPLRLLPNNGSH